MALRAGAGAGSRAGKKLSLKARALALLAQREHSVTELRRKLLRLARAQAVAEAAARDEGAADSAGGQAAREGVDDAESPAKVDELIDWLRAHRYLSEERFAESRVHARSARCGNLRIRQELAQHGLALPAQVVQALKDSELQRATQVWQRKFGVVPADAAARARQARFFAQRGFSLEVITRLLRGTAGADVSAEDD